MPSRCGGTCGSQRRQRTAVAIVVIVITPGSGGGAAPATLCRSGAYGGQRRQRRLRTPDLAGASGRSGGSGRRTCPGCWINPTASMADWTEPISCTAGVWTVTALALAVTKYNPRLRVEALAKLLHPDDGTPGRHVVTDAGDVLPAVAEMSTARLTHGRAQCDHVWR